MLQINDKVRLYKKSENTENFFELPIRGVIKGFAFPKNSCEPSFAHILFKEDKELYYTELLPINARNFKIVKD